MFAGPGMLPLPDAPAVDAAPAPSAAPGGVAAAGQPLDMDGVFAAPAGVPAGVGDLVWKPFGSMAGPGSKGIRGGRSRPAMPDRGWNKITTLRLWSTCGVLGFGTCGPSLNPVAGCIHKGRVGSNCEAHQAHHRFERFSDLATPSRGSEGPPPAGEVVFAAPAAVAADPPRRRGGHRGRRAWVRCPYGEGQVVCDTSG